MIQCVSVSATGQARCFLLMEEHLNLRRELNSLIHRELQNRGDVSKDEHKLRVLESRQEMTGADRQWA